MADLASTRTKILAALDECDTALNQTPSSQVLASVTTLTAEVAALQSKIDKARTDLG